MHEKTCMIPIFMRRRLYSKRKVKEYCAVTLIKTRYLLLSAGPTKEMSRYDYNIIDWDVKQQYYQTNVMSKNSGLLLHKLNQNRGFAVYFGS